MNNMWQQQMSPSDKRYVVQTADNVIERCMLMSTDHESSALRACLNLN